MLIFLILITINWFCPENRFNFVSCNTWSKNSEKYNP